jgi:hypothetical protein
MRERRRLTTADRPCTTTATASGAAVNISLKRFFRGKAGRGEPTRSASPSCAPPCLALLLQGRSSANLDAHLPWLPIRQACGQSSPGICWLRHKRRLPGKQALRRQGRSQETGSREACKVFAAGTYTAGPEDLLAAALAPPSPAWLGSVRAFV